MFIEFLFKYWKQVLGGAAALVVILYIAFTAYGFYSTYETRGKQVEEYKTQVSTLTTSLNEVTTLSNKCSENTAKLKSESDKRDSEAEAAVKAASASSKTHEKAAQRILSTPAKNASEGACKVSEELFKSYMDTYSDSSKGGAK